LDLYFYSSLFDGAGMKIGATRAYVLGFVVSLLLTMCAYWLVAGHFISGKGLVAALMTLALTQFAVQLVFFLHLGQEEDPKWNLQLFLFAVMVVGILVLGSLWIMSNLNYHMDTHKYEKSIIHDEGIK